MKKVIRLMIFIIPIVLLTGCEIKKDGTMLTFINGNTYTHISIGSLIFLVLVWSFIIWWVLAVLKRFLINRTDSNWIKITATIIDENKDYQYGHNVRRAYRQAIVYPDYKIEYYVEGKKYLSFLNGKDLIGLDETVEIEYLKSRPTYIRKAKEK